MKGRKTVRPTTPEDLATIQTAIRGLKAIRSALRKIGARRAALYVQRGIKSVQGAERHAIGVLYRTEEQAKRQGQEG